MSVENKSKTLPKLPGVYLIKDARGEVIYVGKAKNLRSRVCSYFRRGGDGRHSVRFIASRSEDIEYIVTGNEREALILEDTLIKKYRPKYNIRLKDDKTYVSIKVTSNEQFPRISVTRRVKADGGRYFGPYSSASAVRDTVKLIRRIFPVRTCRNVAFHNRVRPCLDYQISICSAPCAGKIGDMAYKKLINGVARFLEGRNNGLIRELKSRMLKSSDCLEFEEAAAIRDKIFAIREMLDRQKVVFYREIDQDIFGYAELGGRVMVKVIFVREGRLVGGRGYTFPRVNISWSEFFSQLLSRYYMNALIPDEIIIQEPAEDADIIEACLSEKRGKKVRLIFPKRGDRVKLIKMASSNAKEELKRVLALRDDSMVALRELQRRFHLKRLPVHIEAVDISNTGGDLPVGALVSFREGVYRKEGNRLFKIRLSRGPDDYGMMSEVLRRRYGSVGDHGIVLPDMLLVDGGRGQLNIAIGVFDDLGIKMPDIVAIAKGGRSGRIIDTNDTDGFNERVYLPNRANPVILKRGSLSDIILRRIRDEVHRLAIGYHKKLRRGRPLSLLDSISGIGIERRKLLLKRFRSVDGVRRASVEELMHVKGISRKMATLIKESLRET